MIISTNNEEDFEYIVLSAEGEYITTLHIANPIDDYTYPLSYTDGLDLQHGEWDHLDKTPVGDLCVIGILMSMQLRMRFGVVSSLLLTK